MAFGRLGAWLCWLLACGVSSFGAMPEATRKSLRAVADLAIGESQTIALASGNSATVRLVDYKVTRDSLRGAIRSTAVTVEVDGRKATIGCGNYHLPQLVGNVWVDCPVVKAYNDNTNRDTWALEKDARIRVWPANSPWMEPGTFTYPLKQKWLATSTQMANEPTFVDGGEDPARKKIYYHNDLDFGGCEGLTEVLVATDGLVVAVGKEILPGYENTPAVARYDGAFVLDERGWIHRYLHLQSFDPAIRLGAKVRRGQKLGLLGKEGDSGGWAHLHYGISAIQPSGKWGTEEAFAYAWEAYREEHRPMLTAVARPHHFVKVGEAVDLQGNAWGATPEAPRYEWAFSDGKNAGGATARRSYLQPGQYAEVLKITDPAGNIAYDFAVVLVVDPARPDKLPPTIHVTSWPTLGIKAGAPVTFKVRTFGTTHGEERWNFGDGSPAATTKSDGGRPELAKEGYVSLTHTYAKPGLYIVTVARTDENGMTATGRVAVEVQ
jgi:murein DD-endopeptidase MepM/ murein hydrolase activator NlpD